MTRQEFEAFLDQHNLSLLQEPMDGGTDCYYRITCPMGQHILVLIWSQESPVRAQCLNDSCKINRHADDSFEFLKSLVQADVAESDSAVPENEHKRDALVPDAQQNARDAPVTGDDCVSDSPVPEDAVQRDTPLPDTDQVLKDALTVFMAQATEQEKDQLLHFLHNGSSSVGIQRFIRDCFDRSFGSKIEEKEVYRLYEGWCTKHGQHVHTKTDLYQLVERQGYPRKKSNGKKYFAGLKVRDSGVPVVF